MRIVLLASAYNSLTQRVHAELADRGHEVAVELALGDELMRDAVRRHDPDLEPRDYRRPGVTGRHRPPCRQADRRIDWSADPTSAVLAKLRAADSRPGVLDVLDGTEYFLFGGHEEDRLRGQPGTIIARRDGAICRATVDGAVWIAQARRRPAPGAPGTFKLPAAMMGWQAQGLP